MKVAIHNSSSGFHPRWVEYCKTHKIPYILVNALDSDIIQQLKGCDYFLWHFSHMNSSDLLVAKGILYALESKGIKVFPSVQTCFTFDDKISQKYLLESQNIPLVQSDVFYSYSSALEWLKKTTFPKVFKLKNGAGSQNVRLVKNLKEAKKLCKIAFSSRFSPVPHSFSDFKKKFRAGKENRQLLKKLLRLPSIIKRVRSQRKQLPSQFGYVYFQEFIPDNLDDIRITVVGKKYIWGYRRRVRPNDFRASGSGDISYVKEDIPQETLLMGIDIAKKLNSQSICIDFITAPEKEYKVVEISYGYIDKSIYSCPGFWDSELSFHEGNYWPQDFILETLLEEKNASFFHKNEPLKLE
ncbi:MAG: hypothetical protein MPJ24_10360 [Pirellulaceae bacterium]|nr:hypothetical protein [Pirellulaceae bacterium]